MKPFGIPPSPGVPIAANDTKPVSRDWYLFFSNLFNTVGSGQATMTLAELIAAFLAQSISLVLPSWLTVAGSPVRGGTGTFTVTGTSEPANRVLASPNGSAGAVSPRALVGADLPFPSASTLGGVESKAAVSHQFLTAIGTDGSVSQAQPAASDVSGLAAIATSGSASDLAAGTVAAARGGAGTITGALKGDGAGVVSQAATADLSDVTATTAWTPTDNSGAGLSLTVTDARYTKIGKLVVVSFSIAWPVTVSAAQANIAGLPVGSFNGTNAVGGGSPALNTTGTPISILVNNNATAFTLWNSTTGVAVTNVNMSGQQIRGTLCYIAA